MDPGHAGIALRAIPALWNYLDGPQVRFLILGGDGMLGHQLLRTLARKHEVVVSLRLSMDTYTKWPLFCTKNARFDVDVRDVPGLLRLVREVRPDVVVNAVGLVKQRSEAKDAIASIEINSLFPHKLAEVCGNLGVRVVHFSTDCVFSGRKGMYTENDIPDAEDLYGRTKLLGEVAAPGFITLRTSIVGLELTRKGGLVEWFLAQKYRVKGYTRAIYSGFTTLEMARIVEDVLPRRPNAYGVYHLSSTPIDKYSLLTEIRNAIGSKVDIEPDDSFVCDRSLDSSRFRREFQYDPPEWGVMIHELGEQIRERQR